MQSDIILTILIYSIHTSLIQATDKLTETPLQSAQNIKMVTVTTESHTMQLCS